MIKSTLQKYFTKKNNYKKYVKDNNIHYGGTKTSNVTSYLKKQHGSMDKTRKNQIQSDFRNEDEQMEHLRSIDFSNKTKSQLIHIKKRLECYSKSLHDRLTSVDYLINFPEYLDYFEFLKNVNDQFIQDFKNKYSRSYETINEDHYYVEFNNIEDNHINYDVINIDFNSLDLSCF